MNTEVLRRAAYISVVAAVLTAAVWVFFRYAAPAAVPFVVGWLVALIVRPAAEWVTKKTKTPYKVAAVVILLTVMIAAVFVSANCITKLTAEAGKMMTEMVGDLETDDNIVRRVISFFDDTVKKLPWLGKLMSKKGVGDTVYQMILDAVRSLASSVSSAVTSAAGSIVKAMPTTLLGTVSGILACFYLTLDKDGFKESVSPLVPAKIKTAAGKIKGSLTDAFGSYVKAYLILLAITFGELLLGFTLLRVEYSFLLAAVIAVIDLLPVLGVGTVLVPWCIACLIVGDYRLAVGLAVLFAVTEIVRQLVEPHLIGKQMGIHPLASVIAVYAGFRLFGIVGMIVAPIVVYFLLNEKGLKSLL